MKKNPVAIILAIVGFVTVGIGIFFAVRALLEKYAPKKECCEDEGCYYEIEPDCCDCCAEEVEACACDTEQEEILAEEAAVDGAE